MASLFSSDSDQHRPRMAAELDGLNQSGKSSGRAARPTNLSQVQNAGNKEVVCRTDRLSINQLTTLRLSFDRDVAEYASAGVRAIGVSWRKLTGYGIRRGIRIMRRSEMPVSSLGWVGGFTGLNGYSFDESFSEAKRAIRVAAQLGAPNLVVVTGPQAGHIRSHARRLAISALKELAPFGEQHGVTLSLKAMAPMFNRDWTFVHGLSEAADMVSQIGHSYVKLAFGAYHHWHEESFLDRVRQIAGMISIAQLADWKQPRDENDQLLPGEGCIPFRELLHALDEGGYSGWFELEVWSRDLWKSDPADLINRCVTRMRSFEAPGRPAQSQSRHA